MANEIDFKLVAIPPEELSSEEFRDYIAMAAPHACFEDSNLLDTDVIDNTDFRRHVVQELCSRYSNFAVSL